MQWLRFSNCVDVWRRNQDHAFQLMNKCLRSMDRAVLAKAFRQWFHGTLHEARAQQAKNAFARVARELATEQNRNCFFFQLARSTHDPLRALRRLDRLDAWRALQTWVDFTVDAVAVRDRLVMAAKTVGQVLCNSEARVLFAGMRAWTLFCRASRKCERLCMRWAHAVEFRAMRTWEGFASTARARARAASIAIRVLGRLRRTEEFAAWRRWETHIAAVIVAQQAAAVRTMQETEACKCALRLLGDASLRAVHTRFALWATNVKMNRLQRRKMRLVLLRMILREQALGMRTWRQEAMKRTEVRRKMRHVLGRMVHSLVSVAWRQWRDALRWYLLAEVHLLERQSRAFTTMAHCVARQRP